MFNILLSVMEHLPTLTFCDALLFVAFCALVVHKIYNKYEIDAADFFPTFVLLVAFPTLSSYFVSAWIESKLLAILISFGLFYAVLITSIVLYRISPMHPLAKYPGPLSLKISKFSTMYYAWNGKQYSFWKSLHDKYGSYVRVGPNELSVVDTDAITPILGVDGTRKGPQWIFHTRPGTTPGIVALRDVDLHHERRKLWRHGFTSASIKELQPTIEGRVLQLLGELNKRASQKGGQKRDSVDLSHWMANFTYDFMGDLVFGGSFDLMHKGDEEGVHRLLEDSMKVGGRLEHIPWITRILNKLMGRTEGQRKFREFGTRCYDRRKQKGATKRDLFLYITNEEGLEKMEVPEDQALNDIFAAMVGGADTTSTVLSGLFHYLLTHPTCYKRLRDEIDSVFPLGEGEPFDAQQLAEMPYLNAVINETLRLQPPLLTSLQRSPIQNSGGKMVAGRFISENTTLYVPPYILHRDERYFSPSPNEFIPDRWLDNSGKFFINAAAYIPFSFGPANCIGKNLAMLEMRMVVTSILQKLDMRLADGYNPQQWEDGLQDYFVAKVGQLPVELLARG